MLARWNDPARSPAVIERVVGEGRVLLWTTTADRAGNDWPIEPSFVLAIREAVRGTARPTSFDHTVTAGERLTRVVHSSHQLANVRLTPPGGGEPKSLTSASIDDRTSGDTTPAWEIVVPDTRRAGPVSRLVGRGAARAPSRTSSRPTPTRAKATSSGSRRPT